MLSLLSWGAGHQTPHYPNLTHDNLTEYLQSPRTRSEIEKFQQINFPSIRSSCPTSSVVIVSFLLLWTEMINFEGEVEQFLTKASALFLKEQINNLEYK